MGKELSVKVLDRFGLKKDPFEIVNAYSPVGKRHEILEQMVHLSQFSNLVIAVVSPAGYGKSVLCKMLDKQLSAEKDLIVTRFNLVSRVSGMSLLQRLSEAWKLEAPSVNRETLLRQLRNDQLKRSTVGLRHCIIIDNAEFVDADGLQMLQALTTGLPEDRSIGLALFCHDSVVDLRSIFKPAESLHVIRLQALTQRDVYAFIKDHFRMAGAKKGVAIPPEAIENIAVDSEGVPAKVIALTREYMVAQSGVQLEGMGSQITKTQRIAIAVVGSAILLSGALFLVQSLFFNATSITPVVNEPLALPTNAPAPASTKQVPISTVNNDLAAPTPQSALSVATPVNTAPAIAKETKATSASTPSVVSPVVNNEAPTPSPEVVAAVTPSPEVTQSAEAPIIDATVVEKPSVANPPVTAPTVTKSVAAATPAAKTTVATKTTSAVSRDWLIKAAPTAYTIQILGSGNEPAVQAYIDGQANPNDFDYVRTTRNGDAWYVVLYRVFDTKDQAVALIPKLPDNIKAKSPWVRSVGSIRPAP